MEKLLITGAGGQLGSELTLALAETYGENSVLATDVNPAAEKILKGIPFRPLDVMDARSIAMLVEKEKVTQIYHLAAILSAVGEKQPLKAWSLNMDSLLSVLELAREKKLSKVYWPSSIAVFGPNTPSHQTPQNCIQDPRTVYGISKQAGEKWCEYYFLKHGVDVRSLRYPGLIGYKSLPGGGTTDYAVEIYHKALEGKTFTCFLKKDTLLPMMYMPDAIKATLALMEAPKNQIRIRSAYNVSAMSITPEQVYQSIREHLPEFNILYEQDYRQAIADGWPRSIDDRNARDHWGWRPSYDLPKMTQDMLSHLPNYFPHLYEQPH
ncbi:NAD-dependent epimerase/dehydratase family protein [Pleomorphovibrio marinus]|uniref:NAD-dependent epimerase/dehydratase family protein n=1 Tax=Pleomorphovibrio marinus TaxID=2164132 RepID=UPI000E0A0027|nr:NAD-dependent epimerase/dehydratase family protein [Pleomorphovibrio marinus]